MDSSVCVCVCVVPPRNKTCTHGEATTAQKCARAHSHTTYTHMLPVQVFDGDVEDLENKAAAAAAAANTGEALCYQGTNEPLLHSILGA